MNYVQTVLENLKKQNPNEPEFHQAHTEPVINSFLRKRQNISVKTPNS